MGNSNSMLPSSNQDIDKYVKWLMDNCKVLPDPEAKILIKMTDLKRLEDRNLWLQTLEAAGVDNWEGYGIAIDMAGEIDPNFQIPRR